MRPVTITNEMRGKGLSEEIQVQEVEVYQSFAEAVASIATNVPMVLQIERIEDVTANITIPANVKLQFTRRGRLRIAAAVTVTIQSPEHIIAEPRDYIIEGLTDVVLATGAVAFTDPGTVHAEWWGAQGDGTTDDMAFFDLIAAALPAGGTLRLLKGQDYLIDSNGIVFTNRINIEGFGAQFTVGDGIGDAPLLTLQGDYSRAEGFKIDGTDNLATVIAGSWTGAVATDRNAILVSGDQCHCHHLHIEDTIYGIKFSAVAGGSVENCHITNATVKTGGGYSAESAGIYLYDSDGLELRGNTVNGYTQNILFALSSNRNEVIGNVLSNADQNGVYISSGHNNRVTNNQVTNFDNDGIKARGNENVIANNDIESLAAGSDNGIIGTGTGSPVGGINGYGIIITQNTVKGKLAVGVSILDHDSGSVESFTIIGNAVEFDSTDETYYGWGYRLIATSDGVIVANNRAKGATRGLVVSSRVSSTDPCDHWIIVGNDMSNVNNALTGALDKGMAASLSDLRYSIIANNDFSNAYAANDNSYGLFLAYATYNHVAHNDCGDHKGTGVLDYGIYESTGCDYNTYWDNNVIRDDLTAMTAEITFASTHNRGNGFTTLPDEATPSVAGAHLCLTGGTTTITDFDNGVTGQEIVIVAEHAVTIQDGTNIFLAGSGNWTMAATDTLTLVCKADNKWYELSRSDNT